MGTREYFRCRGTTNQNQYITQEETYQTSSIQIATLAIVCFIALLIIINILKSVSLTETIACNSNQNYKQHQQIPMTNV